MATIRYLATSGQSLFVDVYDANDVSLESLALQETAIAGVYRADTTVASSDSWACVKDNMGLLLDIVRIEPRIQSIWNLPDALNIWRYLGLK